MLRGPDPHASDAAGSEPHRKPLPCIYRFEDIEVDTAQGCLKKNGQEGYVRQQSFHVLLHLLAHRNQLVGKDELISEFWHDTAVTDNAVVQCITDIRKALGDDSRHPRFIKTIPKVGYRFIGTVEVIHLHEAETAVVPVEIQAGSGVDDRVSSLASRRTTKSNGPSHRAGTVSRRRPPLAAVIVPVGILVLGCLSWLGFLLFGQTGAAPRPAVVGKKSVAVMYFGDQSHRASLGWLREGLADMFIADLDHARGLIVVSRERLHELLDRTGYDPEHPIGLGKARRAARLARAQTVILGSFASLGGGLFVNLQVFDTNTGRLLTVDQFTADRPTDLPGQVDVASLKLAAELSGVPQEENPKPSLADAMTKNMEAYRDYSLGVAKAQSFENTKAIALLKKAIQLDPQFAMAYARIGYAYAVSDFAPAKGRPYLEKVFQLSGRLTSKDRLNVNGWYAIAREDYPAAIRTFRQVIASYPLEIEAYARLAQLLFREEHPREAIAVLQRGLSVDPDAGHLYNVLGICFLGLKRYHDAIAAHEQYVQLAPQDPNSHDSLGMSFEQSGRYSEALAEYKTALMLDPTFEPSMIHMADTYAQQGRYRDAIRRYRRYIKLARLDAARAVGYGDIAQLDLRLHYFPQAEQAAREEIHYRPDDVWNSLLLALHHGNTTTVARLRKKLFESVPYPERGARNDSRSYDYELGMLALKTGHKKQAIADFKEALKHLPPSSGLNLYEDCLGNAYLALGQPDKALKEYRRILGFNPNYPLLHDHMAYAFERKGDEADAREQYRKFLKAWNQADTDIPEVREAKRKLGLSRN